MAARWLPIPDLVLASLVMSREKEGKSFPLNLNWSIQTPGLISHLTDILG